MSFLSKILPSKRNGPPPVQVVSIPRSGHHFLIRSLQAYREGKLGYCEFYMTRRADCCRRIPCTREGIELQKSHDFKGRHPKKNSLRYVIQFRPLEFTLVSEYELFIKQADLADSKEAWEDFARERIQHRRRFVNRWLSSNDPPKECLYLHYDDLTQHTRLEIARVAKFVWSDEDVDMEKMPSPDIIKPRQLSKFRYHDFEFFDYLKDELQSENDRIEALRRF